ncbi:MAG TPA: DegV family protein [Nocardioidaceae bacterium]|nr:DegV family protein [Nocardioidaceae bacterium]
MSHVALVTDSTASLPSDAVEAHGIVVVPLQVVIGAKSYDEGVEGGATAETVAEALREWKPVSTSRPTPAAMLEVYEKAAAAGATEIVSVHLSSELSGTYESAQLAAKQSPVPVTTVDSRQLGMATGFAVISAAEVLAAGGTAEEAAEVVRRRTSDTTSLFYVDTLEYLRRGGRIGAAAALLGSALSVKPLLRLENGRVGMIEKVRTAGRALSRLEELAVEAAGERRVDVAVAHLANPERAGLLAEHLRERLAENLEDRDVVLGEVGAVIGAHVGPGMVAVMVAPRPQDAEDGTSSTAG